jgi:HSP20 family protein
MEVDTMLMRTDPFRDLDRLTQQVFGTAARPALMAMDAWRDSDKFVVEFDLPGIDVNSIDLDVERNVLTVRADRPAKEGIEELVAAERPRGVFSRQLILGDNLDTDKIEANYQAGVLRLEIPVAERAKPRKISVNAADDQKVIDA